MKIDIVKKDAMYRMKLELMSVIKPKIRPLGTSKYLKIRIIRIHTKETM
jgi:hypothetical protein